MKDQISKLIEHVDEDRREFLQRLVKTSAFTVPLALGMNVLMTRGAYAEDAGATSSSSTSTGSGTTGGASSSSDGGTTGGTTSGGESQSSSGGTWYPPPPTSSSASVPEPSSLPLIGLGIASLALAKWRSAKRESDGT